MSLPPDRRPRRSVEGAADPTREFGRDEGTPEPSRTEAARSDRRPRISVPVGGDVRLVTTHPSDLLGILEVYVLDVYESRLLRPGSIVIDLGAGIGDFAVQASRHVGSAGSVVAVEPNPGDFVLLQENVRTMGCKNVTVIPGALADGTDPVELGFKGETFRAQPIGLPDLLRAAGLSSDRSPSRPVVLKLDIEGAEVSALRTLAPLLPSVTAIAIEQHSTEAAVRAILEPLGFVFRRLGRAQYLRHSIGFGFRHPWSAIRLWRMYRRSPRYSGIGKILGGIDVATSADLQVGVYRRPETRR